MTFHNDVLKEILKNVKITTGIKYIPHGDGDGEQMYSLFYKKIYPYNLVSKEWYNYFTDLKPRL